MSIQNQFQKSSIKVIQLLVVVYSWFNSTKPSTRICPSPRAYSSATTDSDSIGPRASTQRTDSIPAVDSGPIPLLLLYLSEILTWKRNFESEIHIIDIPLAHVQLIQLITSQLIRQDRLFTHQQQLYPYENRNPPPQKQEKRLLLLLHLLVPPFPWLCQLRPSST